MTKYADMADAVPVCRFERLDDGTWKLTAPDGAEFVAATLVEALSQLLPDAPEDLVAHLAQRDAGEWACPLPERFQP